MRNSRPTRFNTMKFRLGNYDQVMAQHIVDIQFLRAQLHVTPQLAGACSSSQNGMKGANSFLLNKWVGLFPDLGEGKITHLNALSFSIPELFCLFAKIVPAFRFVSMIYTTELLCHL